VIPVLHVIFHPHQLVSLFLSPKRNKQRPTEEKEKKLRVKKEEKKNSSKAKEKKA